MGKEKKYELLVEECWAYLCC